MRHLSITLIFALFLINAVFAQNAEIEAMPANPIAATNGESHIGKTMLPSLVDRVPFRNMGPSVMSGRVTDVEILASDPSTFYVAYASGGLWKTTNAGTSFEPLFDNEVSMTIGDIAVDWSHDEVIWVGTGESNSSRSSYAGTGLYRSADGGETWEHRGLANSQHISRVILHPTDPNTLWVAALGNLYAPSEDRGVYKTTDGGQTWKKTLFVDENSGAINLIVDPNNPDVLYASTWSRTRRAWTFIESGSGSGIHKSTDGGETWTLLTTEDSGFPTGEGVGRIGLDMFSSEVIFAVVDNQFRRPADEEDDKEEALTRDDLRAMNPTTFLALEDSLIASYLDDNNFPDEYTTAKVRQMIEDNEIQPVALVQYLENANSQLFDTPVIGAEVYRSEDAGVTWQKMNDDFIGAMYFSYGYYFGEIRVDPQDANNVYIMGVQLLKSEDAGHTFNPVGGDNVHADHHFLWINPTRAGHLINGNDGGLNLSYDDGDHWQKLNSPAVGQFYAIAVDMEKPFNVFGGLQDNGVWKGSHTNTESTRWHQTGHNAFESIMGGDGMQIEVDTRTNQTVYTGYQFGNYFRLGLESDEFTYITPSAKLGERPLRFNWQAPILLSSHNQDILYMGSNKLHRSMNQGDDFEEISGDLTAGGKPGDVPYGTLTTISESPFKFGLIYTGSDDGIVSVTKDGGHEWMDISGGLPADMWVSRVIASQHDEATVFVTLNGYRWDHDESYVYRSKDYGLRWERLGINLPNEAVNVIKEDPVNDRILYLGTDHCAYVSIDSGASFMPFKAGLPNVPVHDLILHPRDNKLVLGTHGRSIYLADMSIVQQLTPEFRLKDIHVFDVDSVQFSETWGETNAFSGNKNEPNVEAVYWIKSAGETTISVKNEAGLVVHEETADISAGLNYWSYNLTFDPATLDDDRDFREAVSALNEVESGDDGLFYLPAGKWIIEIVQGESVVTHDLKIFVPPAQKSNR